MSFSLLKLYLNLLNLLNYFATSIYNTRIYYRWYVEIFVTGIFSILTQMHNSYLYLLKKKTNISKNGKTRMLRFVLPTQVSWSVLEGSYPW